MSDSEVVTLAVTERRHRDSELDVRIWSKLVEDLQEEIISRLPLKSLFQAASLSKAWRLRFRSPLFQSEIQNNSAASPWTSYAPLFVNHEQEVVGYDSISNRWHRLPSLYTQEDVGVSTWWRLRSAAGSLLCWTCESAGGNVRLHVTNPLTNGWKQLPPAPEIHFSDQVHFFSESSRAYKVILCPVKARHTNSICFRTYDSTDDSWTVDSLEIGWGLYLRNCHCNVLIDGFLYWIMCDRIRDRVILISFDVKEKSWKEIPVQFQLFQTILTEIPLQIQLMDDERTCDRRPSILKSKASSQAVGCGSNVLLVTIEYTGAGDCYTLSVSKVDLKKGSAIELSRLPYKSVKEEDFEEGGIVVHGDCIYIADSRPGQSFHFILYNVRTNEWHRLHSTTAGLLSVTSKAKNERASWELKPIRYCPGLNPFFKV